MPDYGHPLRFGSFITPVNAPAAPRRRARAAERGPRARPRDVPGPPVPGGVPRHLDPAHLGRRRDRAIHVAGNVLNTPLRQPAVLARAAASLDLLSGGRVELGLGAGGFWGPIAAMGGPEWTAGESVTALGEAIDVIRGIWDVDTRGPLRAGGAFHHVDGAKRGPAPAHPIPIWVGAYKPRMLRLVGTKADGWLPSLPYLQPGDLQRGNAAIDAAATEAGRDPREVTRVLNLGPDADADALIRMALEDGIGVFIVMGDDVRALERFAGDVAPAVREAVAAERASRARRSARDPPPRSHDGHPASTTTACRNHSARPRSSPATSATGPPPRTTSAVARPASSSGPPTCTACGMPSPSPPAIAICRSASAAPAMA